MSSVKVNVVSYVELIALKTWCGAEEVQKYSSTCLEFTSCYFLTSCFSIAKTITDGINTLKKLWNTWNPWRKGSENFLRPWFWHWAPDFQQKLIGFGLLGVFCFVGGFSVSLWKSWDGTLTLNVCPQQVLKMNDEYRAGREREMLYHHSSNAGTYL